MKNQKYIISILIAGILMVGVSDRIQAKGDDQKAGTVKPAQAKQLLVEGNARFVSGKSIHPRQNADRRSELTNSQHPFAIVLGCADSRTGPEIIFDQGLGDLFVVREAGNVIDDHTIGGIEYAVEHVHVKLVVVLGHQRCGAIAAARDTAGADGHIKSLLVTIQPAVNATKGQDAEATCKAHVQNMVHALQTSEPVLKKLVQSGEIKIVGAYYSLETGAVSFLEE
ncbi:MAG: carbonic anhydrase [Bacteroidetes bacterium]|nr:carbonic anhydrase [Bacteroidota bacterium]